MDSDDLKRADPRALRQLARFLGLKNDKEMTDKQVRLWIKYSTRPIKTGWY